MPPFYSSTKMGFDLTISLDLSINEDTGLPFVYGPNCERLPYVPSEFEVPQKYRKWVRQRGHHFHIYIKKFDEHGHTVDAEQFLYEYPSWLTVKKELGNKWEYEYWTEDDHNGFKEALEWFTSKNNFVVDWSY